MNLRNLKYLGAASALFTLIACASSPDAERAELRATVQGARMLADEVTSWREAVPANVTSETIDTVLAFKERADDILGRLEGFDASVTAGADLSDLEHSLAALSQFETDRIQEASAEARGSLLDQFASLADSVRDSASRVAVELA